MRYIAAAYLLIMSSPVWAAGPNLVEQCKHFNPAAQYGRLAEMQAEATEECWEQYESKFESRQVTDCIPMALGPNVGNAAHCETKIVKNVPHGFSRQNARSQCIQEGVEHVANLCKEILAP